MRIRSLRTYNLPDIADHLIHWTGRISRPNDNVPSEITKLSASSRLHQILDDRKIRAFTGFGAGGPLVAFTESTQAAVLKLIGERYEPYGIGFSKQFVFEKCGGPALYVRGDEWPTATQALEGHPLRRRLVRFWPGADPDGDEEPLDDHIKNPSEWLHERE